VSPVFGASVRESALDRSTDLADRKPVAADAAAAATFSAACWADPESDFPA
jgi:hypothetical protein